MTMKKPFTPLRLSLIPVLTGTLILGLPIGSAAAPPAAPLKPGKICTGPTSGTYYQYAGGIIEAAKETLGLKLKNLSTVGSLENAKGIVSGECDIAIVQSDIYIQSAADFRIFWLIETVVLAALPISPAKKSIWVKKTLGLFSRPTSC